MSSDLSSSPSLGWLGGEQKNFCLHWPSFIIAFAIGLFYVYITIPPKKVIVKFPTPYNAGHVIYRDKADSCFKFRAEEVSCPTNKREISRQPLSL